VLAATGRPHGRGARGVTLLFADLLERTYIARMDEYGGERIRYLSESWTATSPRSRPGVTKNGTEVAIESRMNRRVSAGDLRHPSSRT